MARDRRFYIDSTNYNPSDGDQTVASDLRDALEEAFVRYGVRAVLGSAAPSPPRHPFLPGAVAAAVQAGSSLSGEGARSRGAPNEAAASLARCSRAVGRIMECTDRGRHPL